MWYILVCVGMLWHVTLCCGVCQVLFWSTFWLFWHVVVLNGKICYIMVGYGAFWRVLIHRATFVSVLCDGPSRTDGSCYAGSYSRFWLVVHGVLWCAWRYNWISELVVVLALNNSIEKWLGQQNVLGITRSCHLTATRSRYDKSCHTRSTRVPIHVRTSHPDIRPWLSLTYFGVMFPR